MCDRIVRFLGPLGGDLSPKRAWQLIFLSTAICTIGTVILVESLAAVHGNDSFWRPPPPNQNRWGGDDEANWCEAIGADTSAFIIEPSNARSDYTYGAVGFFFIFVGVADLVKRQRREGQVEEGEKGDPGSHTPNLIFKFPAITICNGIFNVFHAFGTFFNHMCECRDGGMYDVAGMFSVMIFSAIYPSIALLPPSWQTPFVVALIPGVQLLIAILHIAVGLDSNQGAMGILVPGVVVNGLLYLDSRFHARCFPTSAYLQLQYKVVWVILTLLSFLFGFLMWNLDVNGIACVPRSLLQGHAAWHVFTCMAIVFLYVFYRSARAQQPHIGTAIPTTEMLP